MRALTFRRTQLCGDGTSLDRKANLLNVGLRILGTTRENSPDSHHSIAFAVGDEKYPTLLKVLEELADQVARLQGKHIDVADHKYKINILFCSDWKFIRTYSFAFI